MVNAFGRKWVIAAVVGLTLVLTGLAHAAPPASQPQRSGAAASESWQAVDCQSDRYQSLAAAEAVATGLLWGQKGKLPLDDPRFNGRIRRRPMMFDDFGNPIDTSPPEKWTFILVRDGQPIQLTVEDPEPLARRIGKTVTVRSKLLTDAPPPLPTMPVIPGQPGQPQPGQPGPAPTVVIQPVPVPVSQAIALPSHLVGWIRAEPAPAVAPIDPRAGWVAVEGDNANYRKWVGGEVTLSGKLAAEKVAGLERCMLVTRGRQVLLARSGAGCAERIGQTVELRGKPLDGRDADATESVSAGWIRTAVPDPAEAGWQVLAGDDASYNALPGPEVVLAGTVAHASVAPTVPPPMVNGRIRPMSVVVDDGSGSDLAAQSQVVVLRCKRGQVLLDAEQKVLVDRWQDKPVQVKCRPVSLEFANVWKWRVGSIRAAGGAAPSSQPAGSK